ncbi:hypothetical protein PU1002_04566 [Candidatus Pelagibacter ubique HTCC1002]|uniref:Lipoprotein n=1 Tax=Pelagibacter ubique (strain HTCC1002) TaxID=314261 RepID=Q1V1B4_PELU1|nr:hypothetical protein [Candidatus Pelagibacter ubique]EAS84964.1 hypothetical protein PU1002_04566 [Candidatus Pelagibacter ubique HTCC1002]MDC0907249.1 hypothetical protein [Candidatus Pelagibacter ubique]
MLRKQIILLLLLLLSSCGYEAIYSKKNSVNYNFSVSELNFVGDRMVNLKIKEKLNNYAQAKKDKDFTLKISSTSEKVILSKNTAGDATSFKNSVSINIEVLMNNKFKSNFIILESFNYNNISNKFNLKQLEKDIKNNLAEIASDKLIFKLSNIQ